VAVRYAWAEVPEVTLWNAAGLPASPFRTDDFPVEFADQVVGSKTPIPENK
jgi:hypothetical protein